MPAEYRPERAVIRLPGTLPEARRRTILDAIERMRQAAADRPDHADWLEDLIEHEFGPGREERIAAGRVPDRAGRSGLSRRAADVIEDEVAYLAALARSGPGEYVAAPRTRYAAMRERDAARARRAARTRTDPLRLPGDLK